MPTRFHSISLLMVAVSLAGCDRAATDPPAPPPPAAAVALEPNRTPAQDVRGLAGLLELEAAHRPAAGITAEQLFDALDTAGVNLIGRTQYVGATMKAAFCAGGRTADGLVVAMCEYASDADADAGLAYMSSTFNIATARRMAHRAAVMTVVHQPDAGDALVDKAFATFLAL